MTHMCVSHVLTGPRYFQEAIEYLERYQLYDEGLTIWQGTTQYQVSRSTTFLLRDCLIYFKAVLTAYGNWLFERRDYKQAALGTELFSTSGQC